MDIDVVLGLVFGIGASVCVILIIVAVYLQKKKKRQPTLKEALEEWQQELRASFNHYENCEGFAPRDDPYIFLDLETTGLQPPKDKIIQIAAIKYQNGEELERFSSFVNPKKHIPKEASNINHIYDDMVKNAPVWDEVAPKFYEFIGEYPLIAHNAQFDIRFIQKQSQIYLKNSVYDTLKLSRRLLNKAPNYKLETLKEILGIEGKSHDALGDCEIMAQVYEYCWKKLEEIKKEKSVFHPPYSHELRKEQKPYFDMVIKILEESDADISSVYVSQSKNLFTIRCFQSELCAIKVGGRLQYLLINVPLDEFKESYQTNLLTTFASQAEGDKTRVMIQSPEDLQEFRDGLITRYNQALAAQQSYIKGKMRDVDRYYSGDIRFKE